MYDKALNITLRLRRDMTYIQLTTVKVSTRFTNIQLEESFHNYN